MSWLSFLWKCRAGCTQLFVEIGLTLTLPIDVTEAIHTIMQPTLPVRYWHLLTKVRYKGEVVRDTESRLESKGGQRSEGESSQAKVQRMFQGNLIEFRGAR